MLPQQQCQVWWPRLTSLAQTPAKAGHNSNKACSCHEDTSSDSSWRSIIIDCSVPTQGCMRVSCLALHTPILLVRQHPLYLQPPLLQCTISGSPRCRTYFFLITQALGLSRITQPQVEINTIIHKTSTTPAALSASGHRTAVATGLACPASHVSEKRRSNSAQTLSGKSIDTSKPLLPYHFDKVWPKSETYGPHFNPDPCHQGQDHGAACSTRCVCHLPFNRDKDQSQIQPGHSSSSFGSAQSLTRQCQQTTQTTQAYAKALAHELNTASSHHPACVQ